ncbi:MAG: 4-hydroxy-3-methylbut-2-en-1-yl diphosphate synthase, partial [Verrucomicrobiales bacterium]
MSRPYSPSPLSLSRRPTRSVMIGPVGVGGTHPVRVQSMLTSDTREAQACIIEAMGLVEAG